MDQGGPLREYFCLVLAAIAANNTLLCGPHSSRRPNHHIEELERMTFFYIGVIVALSLVHGGPAPQFFSPAVADYIVCGVQGVKATVSDIPHSMIRQSLQKVYIGCSRVCCHYQVMHLCP